MMRKEWYQECEAVGHVYLQLRGREQTGNSTFSQTQSPSLVRLPLLKILKPPKQAPVVKDQYSQAWIHDRYATFKPLDSPSFVISALCLPSLFFQLELDFSIKMWFYSIAFSFGICDFCQHSLVSYLWTLDGNLLISILNFLLFSFIRKQSLTHSPYIMYGLSCHWYSFIDISVMIIGLNMKFSHETQDFILVS